MKWRGILSLANLPQRRTLVSLLCYLSIWTVDCLWSEELAMHLMTRLLFCVVLTLSAISLIIVDRSLARSSVVNPPPKPQGEKPFNHEQALAELRKAIAGKEQKPATEVFKNVRELTDFSADRILPIMERTFSRALGVDCTYCHVPGEWDKDDKPTKQIAREMFKMATTINLDILKTIKNLKSANPTVNCTTCHRGQLKPATKLPEKPKP